MSPCLLVIRREAGLVQNETHLNTLMLKQRRGREDMKQRQENKELETLRTRAARRKRDKSEGETPGTDQQGCGEWSLISQHHLLPVPGLKAPLMSNLPQQENTAESFSRLSPVTRAPHLCSILYLPLQGKIRHLRWDNLNLKAIFRLVARKKKTMPCWKNMLNFTSSLHT